MFIVTHKSGTLAHTNDRHLSSTAACSGCNKHSAKATLMAAAPTRRFWQPHGSQLTQPHVVPVRSAYLYVMYAEASLLSCCAVLRQAGGYPAADSLTVTTFPKLNEVLASMHQQAGEDASFVSGTKLALRACSSCTQLTDLGYVVSKAGTQAHAQCSRTPFRACWRAMCASLRLCVGPPPASIASAQVVDSLDSLLAEVQADAAFW